jgi:hypothetical protein
MRAKAGEGKGRYLFNQTRSALLLLLLLLLLLSPGKSSLPSCQLEQLTQRFA